MTNRTQAVWSPQQDAALKAIQTWVRAKRSPQVFRLFGYAGTGKTALAREISNLVKGKVCFAAYTGKAALVMKGKGCAGASTIHSLIYSSADNGEATPDFILNPASKASEAKLIVVDECSMVDDELGNDLLSFGTKVLVIGDPAQLPPPKNSTGAGFFTSAAPDIMLTEVHRQAKDNPIIRMSMDVREGRALELCNYGHSRVIPVGEITPFMVMAADQVLVGKNRTRRLYNNRMRVLKNIDSILPVKGDRLVCLRNNRGKKLLNGGLWNVDQVIDITDDRIEMLLTPEDAGVTDPVTVNVHPWFFLGRQDQLDRDVRRSSDEFDFGNTLTVHKSQGSQWGRVVLFDESRSFRDDAGRWLYTGITRAANQITVVLG